VLELTSVSFVGTNRLEERRETHQNIQQTENVDHQFRAQDGMGANTQQQQSDTHNDEIQENAAKEVRKTIVEQIDESMKELLREQQEIEGLLSHKEKEGYPQLQREGERGQGRGKQSQEGERNTDQELAVLLEDNAELQDLLKEEDG